MTWRAAQIIRLALMEERVVLIVAAGRGSHSTNTPGAEVIFLFEVMSGVGGESGLALRSKCGVRHSVGESTSSAEVHNIANGHPSRDSEEKARLVG